MYEASDHDFDMDDSNTDFFTVGKKVKIDLADMDYRTWREELQADADISGIADAYDCRHYPRVRYEAANIICSESPKKSSIQSTGTTRRS